MRFLEYVCLFTEIYEIYDDVILKLYWIVFYSDLEEVSISIISLTCFHLNR